MSVEKNGQLKSNGTEQVAELKSQSDKPILANVGYAATYTQNLGNFEHVKLTVSLYFPVEVPVDPKKASKDLDATMDFVEEWVEKRMTALVEELKDDGED